MKEAKSETMKEAKSEGTPSNKEKKMVKKGSVESNKSADGKKEIQEKAEAEGGESPGKSPAGKSPKAGFQMDKKEGGEKKKPAFVWKEGKVKPGFERPVILHRAILGSVERMVAILTEHYGGKWPFWLSPRQIMIVPVASTFNDYA